MDRNHPVRIVDRCMRPSTHYTQNSSALSCFTWVSANKLPPPKDVVGEVETFNYPRFVMEGFHFLGASEGSLSATEGDGGMSEAMGEAVRMYTLQTRYTHTVPIPTFLWGCFVLHSSCSYGSIVNDGQLSVCLVAVFSFRNPPGINKWAHVLFPFSSSYCTVDANVNLQVTP